MATGPAQWQPIATAPKDGTAILALSRSLGYVIVLWSEDDNERKKWSSSSNWRVKWDGDFLATAPTHWIPIPAPPEAPDAP